MRQAHHQDDKKLRLDEVTAIGRLLPQILGYFQIYNPITGKYLVYRRKGKEEGLHGKYSMGVGGHVDITDGINNDGTHTRFISEIINAGAARELKEELGIDLLPEYPLHYSHILSTNADTTSQLHVGLIQTLCVRNSNELEFDPAEYPWHQWMTIDEIEKHVPFTDMEEWTKLVFKHLQITPGRIMKSGSDRYHHVL